MLQDHEIDYIQNKDRRDVSGGPTVFGRDEHVVIRDFKRSLMDVPSYSLSDPVVIDTKAPRGVRLEWRS